jgi:protocatechuate 3,4-dioxygenase beta subunit
MAPALLAFVLIAMAPPAAQPRPGPTPTPAPPVLEGVVKGQDGKPVAQARVYAQSSRAATPSAFTLNSPVDTRTDAAGRFRLPLRVAGTHTVRVEAAGLAAVSLEKVDPKAPLAVTLARGATIGGTVRDTRTGTPVPHVIVEARPLGRTIGSSWDADANVVRAETNTEGAFRLEGVAPGLHTVTARARGFDTARREDVRAGGSVDLYLFPGSTLSGVVRDAQGRPVPGAAVRAEAEAHAVRFQSPGWWTPIAADAKGRFEIAGIKPGTYRIVVRSPGFAPGFVPGVSVQDGSDAEVDVVLYAGGTVSGRLLDKNDRPVVGRVTVQELEGQDAPFGLEDVLATEAGADGRFRLTALPPGSHALAVLAPGHGGQRVAFDVGTTGEPVDLGDIVLETGLAIRGRVRDKAGLPVSDAQVAGWSRSAGFRPPAHVSTASDGSYVLAGLQPGSYNVKVTAPGYGEDSRSAEAGAEGVDFALAPSGAVTGTVVDEAGQPVDAFQVMIRPARDDAMVRTSPKFEQVADASGRFRIDDVGEGTYAVVVSAPERASGVATGVKVTSGGTTDVGRLRLGAGGTVQGTVADASGAPVMGATVTATGAAHDYMSGNPPRVTTDAAGAFEVRGLAAGVVQVTASHPQYAGARTSVELDPSRGPADVRVVMTQGGRVDGSVRRRDGSALPGVMVQIMPMGAGGGFSFPGQHIVTTDGDGRFAFEHVSPGRAHVTLLLGSQQYQAGSMRELEVREGETTVTDFVSREILVSGHVTRNGSPAPGLRVSLRGERQLGMFMTYSMLAVAPPPPSGPQRGTAITREDGSYEMIVDEPGNYHATAASVDGRLSYPARTVYVEDRDTFTLDLSFSGVAVSGLVVDRDTEQPVADVQVHASARDPERKEGRAGAGGSTGADGRFVLELDPGEYRLTTFAQGYAPETQDLSVSANGAGEQRIALSRGGMIAGRLVDASGRPVGGLHVSPGIVDGGSVRYGMGTQSLPDGAFQLHGLGAGTYFLSAQTQVGAFALRTGVQPGQKNVDLVLQPGGIVQLAARGPDGAPLEGASARVTRHDGAPIVLFLGPATDAQGNTTLQAPAGPLELTVSKDKLEGRVTVSVAAGATVPAEVSLEEKRP